MAAQSRRARRPQEITDLKRQLQTMQRQIDALTRPAPEKTDK